LRQHLPLLITILGVVVTALGVVLAQARDSPRTLLPFTLIGIGLAVAALPWTLSGKRHVDQRRAVAVGLILSLLGGAIFIWPRVFVESEVRSMPSPYPSPSPYFTPEPAPTTPAVTVVQPNTIGQPLDGCVTIQFEAQPPHDWTFVVANRRSDEELYYFEGEVSVDPDNRRWSAYTTLGADGDGMGSVFEIYVVMLPEELATYLRETHTDGDKTWWASRSFPPGAQHAKTVEVLRNDEADLPCAA
jgi:hypothetical protein